MFKEKIQKILDRNREIEQLLTLSTTVSDNATYSALMREYASISEIVSKIDEYNKAETRINDAEELLKDANIDEELRDFAVSEYKLGKAEKEACEAELRELMIPNDPNDMRNVVIEIRQGAGGEEAALFAADIYRMYSMYATRLGFSQDVLNTNLTELGGIK